MRSKSLAQVQPEPTLVPATPARRLRCLFYTFLNRSAGALLWLSLPLARALSAVRLRLGRPRSLWGTTPIITLPVLARADRLLGVQSETVVFTTYHITAGFDRVLKDRVEKVARRTPDLLPALHRLLLLQALLRYDVFHLFFDQGLLERSGRFGISPNELRWLRRARKRVYLYAYGADVRTRGATLALGKYNCCLHCDQPGKHCLCDDVEGAGKQAVYREYATALLSMGDMMTYVPGARNVPYWPFDLARVDYVGVSWDGKRPLKILHVPNHEWAKGSSYLLQALQHLRRRGIVFEYLQVSQKSNQEVLRLMGEADIVADQFLIGWHGYTALEALALGKVVLCYIRDWQLLPESDSCPLVSANPDNLEDVLAAVAGWGPGRFAEAGRAGRRYVERNYSIPAVSRRLASLYLETGAFPSATAKLIWQNAAA